MKRMFISLLLVAATISAMAAPVWTAKATLKVGETEILLRASDELTQEQNSYWAPMIMEGKDYTLYAWVNDMEYQRYFVKNLEGLKIGVYAKTAGNLTITASNVQGDMWLVDTKDEDKPYKIVEGEMATFNAAAGATNDRFKLTFIAPVSAEPSICHRYGKLEVSGSKGMTVKVLNMDGSATSIADYTPDTDETRSIDLKELEAGYYKVVWNNQELIIKK